MDLHPSDEQRQLIESFAALYAKESPSERVRAAEPLGADPALWDLLRGAGVVEMAVAEDRGGWGATLLDLALVAREHGRALGPAPVLEAQVGARLLARCGATGDDLLAGVLAGERVVVAALRPLRDGVARLVPGGAVATDVVVWRGDDLVAVAADQGRTLPETYGALPVADLAVPPAALAGASPLASGPAARRVVEAAWDDLLVLTAAALVGMAQRSLELGVAYANEREAFGQKIGGFQSIGHGLADGATATDAADLLTLEAAWSEVEDPDRTAELAAMAFAFATEAARDVTDHALHLHGGYGFMLEYDIQLYYRRARAWAAQVMSPSAAWRRVADLRYGPRGGHDGSGTR